MAADDRLVFAVRNDRWRYLTIAALDDAGALTCCCPHARSPAPPGCSCCPSAGLPAAARGPLRLVAMLTDVPLPDRELAEAARGTVSPGTGFRIEVPLMVRPAGRMR